MTVTPDEEYTQQPRVLGPMTCGELINEAFDLYKSSFPLLVGVGGVVYLPCLLFVPYAVASGLFVRAPLFGILILLALLIALTATNGAMIGALTACYLG